MKENGVSVSATFGSWSAKQTWAPTVAAFKATPCRWKCSRSFHLHRYPTIKKELQLSSKPRCPKFFCSSSRNASQTLSSYKERKSKHLETLISAARWNPTKSNATQKAQAPKANSRQVFVLLRACGPSVCKVCWHMSSGCAAERSSRRWLFDVTTSIQHVPCPKPKFISRPGWWRRW